MGMTNFEFFAIVVFVMAVLGLAAWREIKAKRDEAEARMDRYEEKARRAAQARRNEEEDARLAKLYAADDYNEACNIEPFCGEGKKP